MKEREKERKRCSYYFGSEQTPNDASIPAAVNEKQQRGKTGERTSFHAGKVVIILISPCLNLNRGPKLEFAAQTWDPHVCVCVCVCQLWMYPMCLTILKWNHCFAKICLRLAVCAPAGLPACSLTNTPAYRARLCPSLQKFHR